MAQALLVATLAKFPSNTVTWRLLDTLLKGMPKADRLVHYEDLKGARAARFPAMKMAGTTLADQFADDDKIRLAIVAARSIDAGSKGITVMTGVRSALGIFFDTMEPRTVALEQQRIDAALKTLALAYIVAQVLPGAPEDKVAALRQIPAGRQLILYFGAVELAMPLAAEINAAEGHFLKPLVDQYYKDIAKKLVAVLGKGGLAEAQAFLPHIIDLLEETARFVVPHTDNLAATVNNLVPSMVATSLNLSMMAATGADALPTYECLVPRFAAEACLWRASLAQAPINGSATAAAVLTGIQPDDPDDDHPNNPFEADLGGAAIPQPDNPFAPVQGAPPAWGGSTATLEQGRSAAEKAVEAAPTPQAPPFIPANPFADPEPAENPFAEPAAVAPENPFADPEPARAPEAPANPFAPEDAVSATVAPVLGSIAHLATSPTLVATELDLAPEPEPAPPVPASPAPPPASPPPASPAPRAVAPAASFELPLPTEPLPVELQLRGAWVDRSDGERWLFFDVDGGFTTVAPRVTPLDWAQHRAAGHPVGLYLKLPDGTLRLTHPDGQIETLPLNESTYTLTVGESTYHRADYDLTGRVLSGTWRCRLTGDEVRLQANGAFFNPAEAGPQGTYALGASTLALHRFDGVTLTLPMYSDLQPDPIRPDEIMLSGTPWDRVG